MIYTQLTNRAMQIAYRAHHGQTDRSGVPYVFHPFHLAEQMETEETTVAALLHDVAEDTELTLDDLRETGIPERVLEALALLTHDPAVPYLEYVARLKDNEIARAVKLADLKHNSDLTRLNRVGPRDLERVEKYRRAMEILQ